MPPAPHYACIAHASCCRAQQLLAHAAWPLAAPRHSPLLPGHQPAPGEPSQSPLSVHPASGHLHNLARRVPVPHSSVLPGPPTPPPGEKDTCKYYIIQSGDTLETIALSLGLLRLDLEEINPQASTLQVGWGGLGPRRAQDLTCLWAERTPRHPRCRWGGGAEEGFALGVVGVRRASDRTCLRAQGWWWCHDPPKLRRASYWVWAGGQHVGRSGQRQCHPCVPAPAQVNQFVKLTGWRDSCPEPGNSESCRVYIAEGGDSLSTIAMAFSVDLGQVRSQSVVIQLTVCGAQLAWRGVPACSARCLAVWSLGLPACRGRWVAGRPRPPPLPALLHRRCCCSCVPLPALIAKPCHSSLPSFPAPPPSLLLAAPGGQPQPAGHRHGRHHPARHPHRHPALL